ncbi:MAG: acylphosphatase, partial [Erysipelotrichia bacterium]|nr:acylphosphatase [Erysipelotrichia bacterium]
AEGQVQGVGFRWVCRQYAQQLGLTGTVRNMNNGMVEIFVQGEESKVDELFECIQQKDRWIKIDNLTVKEIPALPGETGFEPIL